MNSELNQGEWLTSCPGWPFYPREGTAVHSEQETEWELAELDAVKETHCTCQKQYPSLLVIQPI
jgi:hypothetical protein